MSISSISGLNIQQPVAQSLSDCSDLTRRLGGIQEEGSRLQDLLSQKGRLSKQLVGLDERRFSLDGVHRSMREVVAEYRERNRSLGEEEKDRFTCLLTTFIDICRNNQVVCDQIEQIDEDISKSVDRIKNLIGDYRDCLKDAGISKDDRISLANRARSFDSQFFRLGLQINEPVQLMEGAYRRSVIRRILNRLPTRKIGKPTFQERAITLARTRGKTDLLINLLRQGAVPDLAKEVGIDALKKDNVELVNACIAAGFKPTEVVRYATMLKFGVPILGSLDLKFSSAELGAAMGFCIDKDVFDFAFQLIDPLKPDQTTFALSAAYTHYMNRWSQGKSIHPGLLQFIAHLVDPKYGKNCPLKSWIFTMGAAVDSKRVELIDALCQTDEQREIAIDRAIFNAPLLAKLSKKWKFSDGSQCKAMQAMILRGHWPELLELIQEPAELGVAVVMAAMFQKIPIMIRLLNQKMQISENIRKDAINALSQRESKDISIPYCGLVALIRNEDDLGRAVREAAANQRWPLMNKLLKRGDIPEKFRRSAIEYTIGFGRLEFTEKLIQTPEDRQFAISYAFSQGDSSKALCLLKGGEIPREYRDYLIRKGLADGDSFLLYGTLQAAGGFGQALMISAEINRETLNLLNWAEENKWPQESRWVLPQSELLSAARSALKWKNWKLVEAIDRHVDFQGFDFACVKEALEAGFIDRLAKLYPFSEAVKEEAYKYCVQHFPSKAFHFEKPAAAQEQQMFLRRPAFSEWDSDSEPFTP